MKNKTEISKWSDLDDFLTVRFQSLETVFDFTHLHEAKETAMTDMFLVRTRELIHTRQKLRIIYVMFAPKNII